MPKKPKTLRTQSRGKQSTTGQLRIIAGQWRSRKLPVANLPGLRPTSDRIRETVFNWLNPHIPGAHVLDCFSGTGALSLEALSRGAESALLLEKSDIAATALQSNLETLKADNADVIHTDSLLWLQKSAQQPFDIIFLDPPFHQNLLEPTAQLLEKNSYLKAGSLVYVEVEKELAPLPTPNNWQPLKAKTGGQVSFSLWIVS